MSLHTDNQKELMVKIVQIKRDFHLLEITIHPQINVLDTVHRALVLCLMEVKVLRQELISITTLIRIQIGIHKKVIAIGRVSLILHLVVEVITAITQYQSNQIQVRTDCTHPVAE
jgi:hypothetical protein